MIKTAQLQNGLRHSDYQRYRCVDLSLWCPTILLLFLFTAPIRSWTSQRVPMNQSPYFGLFWCSMNASYCGELCWTRFRMASRFCESNATFYCIEYIAIEESVVSERS
jgi:hypothetical protein